jgi:hypothetical protein
MDPETQRQLITALAAIAGALIGFMSAQLAAERTLRGQRKLARDSAIRDARRAAVQPLLDMVTARSNLFYDLYRAVHFQHADLVARIEAQLVDANPTELRHMAIQDDAWVAARRSVQDAEDAITIRMLAGRHGPGAPPLEEEALLAAARAYRAAAIELNRIAEDYWQALT